MDPQKSYTLYVEYFNVWFVSQQWLHDDQDRVIHTPVNVANRGGVHGFALPPASYADGQLTLRWTQDNPQANDQGVYLSQLWLVENKPIESLPQLNAIHFNDRNADGRLSVGDDYHLTFSHAIDHELLATEIETHIVIENQSNAFGEVNRLQWSGDAKTAIITLSEGFSLQGNEVVSLQNIMSQSGLPVVGSATLSLEDSVPPTLTGYEWEDTDGNGTLSVGDRYHFHFSETIQTTLDVNDFTPDVLSYGNDSNVVWFNNDRSATLAITDGFSIIGNESLVLSAMMDQAGNRIVQQAIQLAGKDETQPFIRTVSFNDRNGDGQLTVGDQFLFTFSEAITVDDLEANSHLSPAGASYGTVNQSQLSHDTTEIAVTLTQGFTLNGDETVRPSTQIEDVFENTATGAVVLSLQDLTPPRLTSLTTTAPSPIGENQPFSLRLQFDSALAPTALPCRCTQPPTARYRAE